jgi:hypothetical protein
MALQRTRRPRIRSGRSLCSLGSPLNAGPLDGGLAAARLAVLALSALLVSVDVLAGTEGCSRLELEKALEKLRHLSGLGEIYVEDAAADGSVVMIPPDYRYARPEVVLFLKCENQAAEVLIDHLDDTRLTSARFKGGTHWGRPIPVPLGFVCLDILISLSQFGSAIRDPETENNDGLGSGVRGDYYFRPDDYEIRRDRYFPLPHVFEVKASWRKALRDGRLRFEYSNWHKGIAAAVLVLGLLGFGPPVLSSAEAPATPRAPYESEVRAAHEAYWHALLTEGSDVALERFCAEEYTYVGVDGVLIDKAGLKARTKRNELTNLELKDDLRRLSEYGTVAVISGQSESVVRDKGNVDKSSEGYTEVWVKRGDGWKLVAEQVNLRNCHGPYYNIDVHPPASGELVADPAALLARCG